MAIQRKYENYKIIITYDNGNTEEINYKGINTSNYKDMLNLYKEAKSNYINECVTIDFVGTNSEGEMRIFFTKKIESKSEETKEENRSTKDMLINLADILNLLEKQKEKLSAKQGVLDKEEDKELHKIESFNEEIFINKEELIAEKLKIFDNIKNIRKERRLNKEEFGLISCFNQLKGTQGLKDKVNQIIKSFDIKSNKKYQHLTDEKVEQFKIMKRIKYKTEKERMAIVKENLHKFNKVYYENGEVICYNKAK